MGVDILINNNWSYESVNQTYLDEERFINLKNSSLTLKTFKSILSIMENALWNLKFYHCWIIMELDMIYHFS